MKKSISLIFALVFMFSLCGCEQGDNGYKTEKENKASFNKYKVGDSVFFGLYEQDNDFSNGAEKIEWQVLAVQDDKILVISNEALDCQPYNSSGSNISWEDCTLREWLNNHFINTAFTEDEKNKISMVTVPADKSNVGNDIDTNDKVFLLSLSELNEYFAPGDARKCIATAYAESKGANGSYHGECWWWLRSACEPVGNTNFLNYVGPTYGADSGASNISRAVRPAMWLEIV